MSASSAKAVKNDNGLIVPESVMAPEGIVSPTILAQTTSTAAAAMVAHQTTAREITNDPKTLDIIKSSNQDNANDTPTVHEKVACRVPEEANNMQQIDRVSNGDIAMTHLPDEIEHIMGRAKLSSPLAWRIDPRPTASSMWVDDVPQEWLEDEEIL
jgi:hypothetical protein